MNLRLWRDYLTIKHSGMFDAAYYLRVNKDVRQADIDPLMHFVRHGWVEGRLPSENFSPDLYSEAIGQPDGIHALAERLKRNPRGVKPARKSLGQYLKFIAKGFKLFIGLNGVVFFGGYPFLEREKDGYYQRIRVLDTIFKDKWRIYVDNVDLPGRTGWYELPAEKTLILRPRSQGRNYSKARLCLLLLILRSRKLYFHSILSIPNSNILWELPSVTRILDFHGVVPEEFEFQGDRASSSIFAEIERKAVLQSNHIIVVTDAMRTHIESKYQKMDPGKFITLPIFHDLQIFDLPKPYPNNKPIVVYAGGLQKWQQVPKMIDAILKTYTVIQYKFLCPQPQDFISLLPEVLKDNPALEIDSKPFTEITQVYRTSHYGFILREDIPVNRVACPTKLIEYLGMGVVPIMDSEDIGDFKTLGMQFIKLASLLTNELPEEEERQKMAEANFIVYKRLRSQYDDGMVSLRKVLGFTNPPVKIYSQ